MSPLINARLISLFVLSTLLSYPALAEKNPSRTPEVDELIKRQIATFQEPSNAWISHIWFTPGNHHIEAIEALEKIGAPAIEPLIETLKDPSEEVRYLAIYALGKIGDRSAVPALIRTVRSDPFWGVRHRAASVLEDMQDPRAVDALLEGVRMDRADGPDFFAISALSAFPSKRAVRALIPLLVLDAPEYSQQRDLGEYSAYSLGEMGFVAEGALLEASHSKDPVVRRHAATGLGVLRREEAVDRLLELLEDAEPRVRSAAIRALHTSRERRAAVSIAEILSDPDPQVRFVAALGLGYLGEAFGETLEPQVASALIRSFNDENLRVAIEAVKSVGRMRSRTAVLPLCMLLAGGTLPAAILPANVPRDGFVRREAVVALGLIGDRRALGLLLASASDEDAFVRGAACEALGAFKDDVAIRTLVSGTQDSSSWVRAAAIKGLVAVGAAGHTQLFTQALEDDSETVRVEAALALGAFGGAESIQPLRKMVQRDERNYPVYSKAQRAIRLIRLRLQDGPRRE